MSEAERTELDAILAEQRGALPPAPKRDIAELLCEMRSGEARDYKTRSGVPVSVAKYGKDEFRVNGDLATSYPNTVRLLRSLGIEEA